MVDKKQRNTSTSKSQLQRLKKKNKKTGKRFGKSNKSLSRFVPFSQDQKVLAFAHRLNYPTSVLGHLPHALSHRTYHHETPQIDFDNQKLEFLGDACLGLCVAHKLMELHPQWTEGQLSTARSRLINSKVLAQCADHAGLDDLLRIGKGEANMGESARQARLADAFESVAGALYLDLGFEDACDWIWTLLVPFYEQFDLSIAGSESPKAQLHNWCQDRQYSLPTYHLIKSTLATSSIQKLPFTVRCSLELSTQKYEVEGHGHSKKDAEHQAAKLLFKQIHHS